MIGFKPNVWLVEWVKLALEGGEKDGYLNLGEGPIWLKFKEGRVEMAGLGLAIGPQLSKTD